MERIWLAAAICALDAAVILAAGRAAQRWGEEAAVSPAPCVALTFDDGPDPVCTPALLDGLKKRGIRASFFLLGDRLEGNEELIRRMRDDGHLIGSHGARHEQLTKLPLKEALAGLEETRQALSAVTEQEVRWLRPPYGAWSEQLDDASGLSVALWSVDSLDWQLQDSGRIVFRVLSEAGNGDIILMHDIFPASVEAALALADRLMEAGYAFVTVDELLID